MNPKLCVIPLILIGTLKSILSSGVSVLMVAPKYSLQAIGKNIIFSVFQSIKNSINIIKLLWCQGTC